jgi:hypothetical protein
MDSRKMFETYGSKEHSEIKQLKTVNSGDYINNGNDEIPLIIFDTSGMNQLPEGS